MQVAVLPLVKGQKSFKDISFEVLNGTIVTYRCSSTNGGAMQMIDNGCGQAQRSSIALLASKSYTYLHY